MEKGLATVLMNLGESKAALEELERAESLKSGMPENLLELGRAHTRFREILAMRCQPAH